MRAAGLRIIQTREHAGKFFYPLASAEIADTGGEFLLRDMQVTICIGGNLWQVGDHDDLVGGS